MNAGVWVAPILQAYERKAQGGQLIESRMGATLETSIDIPPKMTRRRYLDYGQLKPVTLDRVWVFQWYVSP